MKFNMLKGPFIKSKNNTNKIMTNLLIALIPIILFSFYKNGILLYQNNKTDLFGMFYPLIFIFTGIITSFLVETIYAYLFLHLKNDKLKDYIKTSFSIFPGLFVSLVLPINTPIEILILGCLVATIIGKMIYGGFGHNIFNPALIGCLFVLSTYSTIISSNGGFLNKYELDTIGGATPLTNAKIVERLDYDSLVKPYGDLSDFFFGNIPGTLGETCSFLIILAFIYLLLKHVIKWKIPIIYVSTVFIMTLIIGKINGLGLWYPLFSILSGGLLFGAVFMATDPVTSPTTSLGQVIYAFLLGILTVTFRYLTNAPEGVLTSILTMNMFVPLLDRIGSSNKFAYKKALIPLIAIFILLALLSINIGNSFNTSEKEDSNFKILEKTNSYYIVTEKGNGGPIKAKIYIDKDTITKIEILENNETESYYKLIEEANYINKLINNQKNIENVDTVSGATISSTALKKMVINVLDDMEG
ncbi:MAG: RnfABCDGE type electron transport complex subunit D [Bacilli bacterium]|nr:RnfABCDGE type electron transport complex subunit D [Bacilli bacterium]